jgi:hypothetical protein
MGILPYILVIFRGFSPIFMEFDPISAIGERSLFDKKRVEKSARS